MVERKAVKGLGKINLTANQVFIAAISALLVALVFALSMVVNKVNNNYPPSVGFSAVGSASITPDGIRLSGSANTLAKSSAAGLSEIAKIGESIRQVLAANNVDKKNISSANLSIYPEYSYTPTGVRNLLGYRVSQGYEVVELEHEAHMMTAVVRQRGVISGAEVEVAETHAAAGRPVEPAQYVEQRRLAGAGRSEQHQEFARVDVQVDAAQGVHRSGPLTIGPLEPPHLEDGRARGAHPSQTLALRNMRIQPESSPVAADAGVRAAGAGSGRQDSCALR